MAIFMYNFVEIVQTNQKKHYKWWHRVYFRTNTYIAVKTNSYLVHRTIISCYIDK